MPLSESAFDALLYIGLIVGIPLGVMLYFLVQVVVIWWFLSLFSNSITSPFAWSVWSPAMPWNILRRRRERAQRKREKLALARDPRTMASARLAHARIQARDRPYTPGAPSLSFFDIRKPEPAVLAADHSTPSTLTMTERSSLNTENSSLTQAEQCLNILEAWWVEQQRRESQATGQTYV